MMERSTVVRKAITGAEQRECNNVGARQAFAKPYDAGFLKGFV